MSTGPIAYWVDTEQPRDWTGLIVVACLPTLWCIIPLIVKGCNKACDCIGECFETQTNVTDPRPALVHEPAPVQDVVSEQKREHAIVYIHSEIDAGDLTANSRTHGTLGKFDNVVLKIETATLLTYDRGEIAIVKAKPR